MEGVAAGATGESHIFLGEYAAGMDVEMVGIAGVWEEWYRLVVTESQTPINRCLNLTSGAQKARSWIDEKAVRAIREAEMKLKLKWVKGHSGVEGNELVDKRAKDGVMRGIWDSSPGLATPAGIRQAYPLFRREDHIKWDRNELRGLTYLHRDKDPMKAWLHKMVKAEDPLCGWVGGKWRRWEDIWTYRELCPEVAAFLGK